MLTIHAEQHFSASLLHKNLKESFDITMVASENRDGLLVTFPIYFGFLAGLAVFSYFRNKRLHGDNGIAEPQLHFLGGRMLGPLLTAGSMER